MPMTFDLVIDYDDGTQDTVRADQRDTVRWEMTERIGTTKALDDCPMTFFRFIGWAALKRTGKTDLARDVWDAGVVSVDSPEDPEEPDPGQPAVSEASSSG